MDSAVSQHPRYRRAFLAGSVSVPPSRVGSPTPINMPSNAPTVVGNNKPPQDFRMQSNITPQRNGTSRRAGNAQKSLDSFWRGFSSDRPSKVYSILPNHLYSERMSRLAKSSTASPSTPSQAISRNAFATRSAHASYEEAKLACIAKVEKIKTECRRLNQKYRDPHFDIEADLRSNSPFRDCLEGLCPQLPQSEPGPRSVKRVGDIFDEPQFFIDGASANDVRQGREGDCWFMSALATLSNKPGLIQRICVHQDEQAGVYGFVFHRDGEWISTVIDDKLYLIKEDFHNKPSQDRNSWLELHTNDQVTTEEEYRKVMQTGSRALYFAQCADVNETWVPLLEKAYAKAHGDYAALESGYVGESLEDLTGGVCTEFFSTDILDKDKFWQEELMLVNKEFLFGCGQPGGSRNGIEGRHAYSIMEAVEVKGQRLLKLRNPWGHAEWKGPWSDGSKQWTAEWLQLLGHSFGDDGVFWISYADLLRNYQHFDRTRLFGPDWTITQRWTSVDVPWSSNYLDTRFKISLTKKSPVVIVLSQLDERYFKGLEGQYEFSLQFRLHADGAKDEDYIVRSNKPYLMTRSVSRELELEAGSYTVLIKITAMRVENYPTVEKVVRDNCQTRREKLLSIGLSYDLAHAKGQFRELEMEKLEQEKSLWREQRRKYAKQAFEARAFQRKKTKLRKLRLDEKEYAKRHRLEQERNRLEEREMERFKLSQEAPNMEHGQDSSHGLGLNGLGSSALFSGSLNGAVQPPYTPPSATVSRASTVPLRRPHSLSVSSRPTSPYLASTDYPPSSNRTRRNTLVVDTPKIRSPSPTPGIRVEHFNMPSQPRINLSDMSDDGLSWDSELDFDSDDEDDKYAFDRASTLGNGFSGFDGQDQANRKNNHDGEDVDASRDPWNAVCVIGLRFYSQDANASVAVRRPTYTSKRRRQQKTHRHATSTTSASVNNDGGRPNIAYSSGTCSGRESPLDGLINPLRGLDVDDNSKDASGEQILSPIREYLDEGRDVRAFSGGGFGFGGGGGGLGGHVRTFPL